MSTITGEITLTNLEENYRVELISTDGLIFKNGIVSTTILANVFKGQKDVTDSIDANYFRWTRVSENPTEDEIWNNEHFGGTKYITLDIKDVFKRSSFFCEILNK